MTTSPVGDIGLARPMPTWGIATESAIGTLTALTGGLVDGMVNRNAVVPEYPARLPVALPLKTPPLRCRLSDRALIDTVSYSTLASPCTYSEEQHGTAPHHLGVLGR